MNNEGERVFIIDGEKVPKNQYMLALRKAVQDWQEEKRRYWKEE